MGYYYGPESGPDNCISGDYPSDSQAVKDGLGRWQAKLGLPVTKHWDAATAAAATALEEQKGWPPNPAFGYGGVHLAEWDRVMRDGWQLPNGWDAAQAPAPELPLVKWGDYSQYQGCCVDDTYPYPAISFSAKPPDGPLRGRAVGSGGLYASSGRWVPPVSTVPHIRRKSNKRGRFQACCQASWCMSSSCLPLVSSTNRHTNSRDNTAHSA